MMPFGAFHEPLRVIFSKLLVIVVVEICWAAVIRIKVVSSL